MNQLLEIVFPNLDPFIVKLWGPVGLRWYGFGYLVAFIFCYQILRFLQRRGYFRLYPEDCGSLIFYAIFGTLLGGRFGYLIFYSDFFSSGRIFEDPLHIIGFGKNFTGGLQGLSFHGGLIGVVVSGSIFVWTRLRRQLQALPQEEVEVKNKKKFRQRFSALWCDCFDACALGVPFGIFSVRVANFINGELYGRIIRDGTGAAIRDAAKAPAWAMRFPTAPEGRQALGQYYARKGVAPENINEKLALPVDSDAWQEVMQNVALRHPSQIYQALLEGLTLLVLVWILRKRLQKKGMVAGIFLMGYGLLRTPVEFFRQPDDQFAQGHSLEGWGRFLQNLPVIETQGQFLSLLMVLTGLSMLIACWRSKNPFLRRSPEELALKGQPLVPKVIKK